MSFSAYQVLLAKVLNKDNTEGFIGANLLYVAGVQLTIILRLQLHAALGSHLRNDKKEELSKKRRRRRNIRYQTYLKIVIIGIDIVALGLLAHIAPAIKLNIAIHIGIQRLGYLVRKGCDACQGMK